MARRHVTTAVTLVVLLGILGAGALYGVKSLFAPVPSVTPSLSASASCTPKTLAKGHRLRTRQVMVSVYNAGTRSGLAGKTQRLLAKRGFLRGDLGNAPSNLRFVQVWTTQAHDPAARLVAAQFGRSTVVKVRKKALGPGIAVLVGNDFRGLVPAPRSVRVTSKQTLNTCP
ncbi:MAG: LytR C-terminal domain-containing protein [Nocardioidaceae bacterium]